MRKWIPTRRLFACCLLLSVLVAAVRAQECGSSESLPPISRQAPGAQGASPAITQIIGEISLSRIYTTVYDLQNFSTRYCRSTGNDQACEYLRGQLLALPRLQVSYDNFTQGGTPMSSLVAALPGDRGAGAQQYIMSAHYDSAILNPGDPYGFVPGADDDATGVAAALDCARVLSTRHFNDTIIFAFWDNEELGMYGSENYAAAAALRGDPIAGMIQCDMLGYDPTASCALSVETYADSEWISDELSGANADYSIGVTYTETAQVGASDHTPFHNHGYASLCVYESTITPFMHTTSDTIDTINPEMVTRGARMCAAALAEMAGIVGSQVPESGITGALPAVAGLAAFAAAAVVWRIKKDEA